MTDSFLATGLAETWRSHEAGGGPGLAQLRARVDRQTTRLRWIARLEIVTTVAVLGGFALSLPRAPADERWAWVAAALAHTAVVAGFAGWNRRGIWRPVGASTREYLTLAAERCRRALRAASFMAGLVAVEGAAVLLWFAADPARVGRFIVLAAGLAVAATLVGAAWYARRVRNELAWLEGLRAAFAEHPSREAG